MALTKREQFAQGSRDGAPQKRKDCLPSCESAANNSVGRVGSGGGVGPSAPLDLLGDRLSEFSNIFPILAFI